MSSPPLLGGLSVIYRDEWLVAINKPSGLRSVPAFKATEDGGEGNPRDNPSENHDVRKRKRQERFRDVLESMDPTAAPAAGDSSPLQLLQLTITLLDLALAGRRWRATARAHRRRLERCKAFRACAH